MKSIQHHYAKIAYEGIMEADAKETACQYGQLCHRFPPLVLTNGLRLAVAFFQAKGKKPENEETYRRYLEHIGRAVGCDFVKGGDCVPPKQNAEYLHLSREVLSASVWFKRYAEAILKVEQAADMELLNGGSDGAKNAQEVQA